MKEWIKFILDNTRQTESFLHSHNNIINKLPSKMWRVLLNCTEYFVTKHENK